MRVYSDSHPNNPRCRGLLGFSSPPNTGARGFGLCEFVEPRISRVFYLANPVIRGVCALHSKCNLGLRVFGSLD